MATTDITMQGLSEQILTPTSFPQLHKIISTLRFPLKVSEVLELRSILNDAIDAFQEPQDTPGYREFREALQNAIDSFGIESKRHSERLLRLLTMLRELHYAHSIASRDTEIELRGTQEENSNARSRSHTYGIMAILIGIGAAITWMGLPEPGWPVKLVTLGSTYMAWDYFHSLPILAREMTRLTQELNDVLRKRVKTLNWKTLIHKLSLLMGYKQISGVEVFRMDGDMDTTDNSYPFH